MELNKKYFRIIISLIILIFVYGCDGFETCYERDDFSSNSEYDTFIVESSTPDCSYDQSKSIAENESEGKSSQTMINCLKQTKLSEVTDNLEGYYYKDTTNSNTEVAINEISCEYMDPTAQDGTIANKYTIVTKTSTEDGKTTETDVTTEAKPGIFLECINNCSQTCNASSLFDENGTNISESSSVSGLWTKGNLKSDSSYVGIKLDKDTYVSISVTGQIDLKGIKESSTISLNKIFTDNIVFNLPLDGNPITNFSIYTLKSGISSANNVDSLLNISYMDLKVIDTSLNVADNIEYYSEPDYSKVKCNYEISSSRDTASCSFDYNDSGNDNESLSNVEGYYNNNYITHVFPNGDFYMYSNNFLDGINLENSAGSSTTGTNNSNLKVTSAGIKLFDDTENSGYIFSENSSTSSTVITNCNKDNNICTFSFNIKKPSKIAVKYTKSGNNIPENCEYIFEESLLNTSSGYIQKDNYQNVSGKAELKNKGNNWVVVKDESDVEVTFNEFSTIDTETETRINFKVNKQCSDGILVKIIPLKEFKINKTGILFFSTPQSMNQSTSGAVIPNTKNNDTIKYRIINPKALAIEYNKNTNPSNIRKKFYETTGSSLVFESKTVSSVDAATATGDYFVRSGQIIRFDYTTFFTFNNDITKLNTLSNNSNLQHLVGLNVFIKEKRPLFCYGTAEEEVSIEKFCSSQIDGKYETIKTKIIEYNDDTTTISEGKDSNVCYVPVDQCKVPAKLVEEGDETKVEETEKVNDILLMTTYNELDYNASGCIRDENKPLVLVVENIYDLWDKVYTDYKYINSFTGDIQELKDSNGNSTGMKIYKADCLPKYEELIRAIYKRTTDCAKVINGTNPGYEIYYDNNGYKVLRNGDKANKEDNLPEEISGDIGIIEINEIIDFLKAFFKTEEISTGSSSEGSSMYKSNFYYYKKPDKETELVSQCYDISNLATSLNYINEKVSENDSQRIITLGAKKLTAFDSSYREGLMKDFMLQTTNETNNGGNYEERVYKEAFYPEQNSFLRILILKNISEENINNLVKFTTEMKKEETSSSPIFQIKMEKKTSYKNGEQLAVFIGCNSEYSNYKGDLAIDESNVIPIVYYKNGILDKEKSLGYFDSSGRLIDKNTESVGISFSNYTEDGGYLKKIADHDLCKDNEQEEIFYFKIIDVDKDPGNNANNYKITIRATNASKNTLITYFRDFINYILSLIDGSKISLKTRDNSIVTCQKNKNENLCVIYDENHPDDNGSYCGIGDSNCYALCESVNNGQDSFSCKTVSDGKGFVKNIYLNFINDPLFQFIAKISLALAITLYGFGYFFGLSHFTQAEIITKLIRFSMIYFLISPAGWNFFDNFVVKFFKDGIDSILFLVASSFELETDSELSLAIKNGNYTDKSVLFTTCFSNLELIFSPPVFNKIMGLAFSSWYGLIYLYLVLMTIINYIVGVFTAIILYITSQIYMSLVFCFFPLVLLFMFFERTKKTFDNWLGQLIGFAGQQIFLVMTLSFFNIIIYNYIKSVFSYRVCWLPLLNLKLGGFPLFMIQWWKIPSSSATRGVLNTIDENMPSFYSIMSFYIVGILMSKFITGATELGSSIFGGMNISSGFAGKISETINRGVGFADQGMKNIGDTFAKGMARRLGGKGIEDYKERREKETKERREYEQGLQQKADKHMKENSKAKVGSKEYEKEREEFLKDQRMQDIKNEKSPYSEKYKSYNSKHSNESEEGNMENFMKKMGWIKERKD